jgi:hypothetical protein
MSQRALESFEIAAKSGLEMTTFTGTGPLRSTAHLQTTAIAAVKRAGRALGSRHDTERHCNKPTQLSRTNAKQKSQE